jgi:hypothetical protein
MTAPETLPTPRAPVAAPPVKKSRRKWPWVVGGIVALLFIIGLTDGGNTSTSAGNTDPAPATMATSFGDGVHTAGVDVAEGTYRTEDNNASLTKNPRRCTWELESNVGNSSIKPNVVSPMIGVSRVEGAFRTEGGCAWTRISG